jgi:hypothetical protein
MSTITFDQAVSKGRTAWSAASRSFWTLGDLAISVDTSTYGDNTIAKLAGKIDPSGELTKSSLANYATTARAYAPGDRSKLNGYTVHQVFNAQDDRVDLVASKRWTVTAARELVASRKSPEVTPEPQPEPEPETDPRAKLVANIARLQGELDAAIGRLAAYDAEHPQVTEPAAPVAPVSTLGELLPPCDVCGKQHHAGSAIARKHAAAA